MTKIAIFGGTGMTGQSTVQYALDKGNKNEYIFFANRNAIFYLLQLPVLGWTVRLLYRTLETVPASFRDKVELVQGDVTNLPDVVATLDGCDCVTVVLGTRNKLEPTKVLSTGMANVLDAMKAQSLRRVSVCLSSFVLFEPGKVPAMFTHLNAEHQAMLDATKASGLDYVAVLPPHIADEPAVEVTILHDASPGRIVPKPNLAKFLVDSLDMPEHWGKVCGIAKKAPPPS